MVSRQAPGWRKAFEDKKRFGMSVTTGSQIADVGAFFTVWAAQTVTSLPQTGWVVLYRLALGFRSHPEQLTLAIRNGEVAPMSERRGGLAVHDHLEIGRKLHREIAGAP
jgi:hypothetical protein